MPRASASSPRTVALAEAVADVAAAARDVVLDRIDLIRLEARDDIRQLAIALVVAGVAVTALGLALLAGMGAMAWFLAAWLGPAGSLATCAILCLALGVGLGRVARAQLPAGAEDERNRPEPIAALTSAQERRRPE